MKLQSLGIRLNIACAGTGGSFISKFSNYNYWIDGETLIDGPRVMVLEIWVNNRRIIRCFQNSASKLLFCEISSWPNKNKKQIVMADFCDEGFVLPSGTLKEIYEFILARFESASSGLAKPGRILNVIKNIRKYEDLAFVGSLDQFN